MTLVTLICGPQLQCQGQSEERRALGSWVCGRQGQRPRELAFRAGEKAKGT